MSTLEDGLGRVVGSPPPRYGGVVAILSEHVEGYLARLRPERPALLAEMEELAARDGIPIVHWETGRLLATLVRALDPGLVLEVGTAIGYSTLHMASALGGGRIVTLERDPTRAEQARGFLARGGVGDLVEILEGDALERLENLEGPFDLVFLDATKTESTGCLERIEARVSERALLVVDNVLMSGEVALGEGSDTFWSDTNLAAARSFNASLLASDGWLGSVLGVGDGLAVAARLRRARGDAG